MKLARLAQNLWRSSSFYGRQTCHNLIFSKPISIPSRTPQEKSLYKRISPIGDPYVSIVPVLNQWVEEGNNVGKEELRSIIQQLRHYKRYNHALEVAAWMCNKRFIPPSQNDVAIHLNLIYKVYGLKQAEEYFANAPKTLKGYAVYSALVECYAYEKSVEKAEALLEQIKGVGMPRMPNFYNNMMKLYYLTRNYEKLDDVMHEMQVRGVSFDKYTYGIRLRAYADASDDAGIDKIVAMVESNTPANMDGIFLVVAAEGYLKVGQEAKAVKMLQNLEGLLKKGRRNSHAFDSLIRMYGEIGMKDKLYGIWNLYKTKGKIYNNGYRGMLASLMKCDDVGGAKRIFEEWESTKLTSDIRIPNMLVNAYARKGLLEEAEIIIKKASAKGIEPLASTWSYIAEGYLRRGDIKQTAEAIRKAILVCTPNGRLKKETLVTFLEYLEVMGNRKGAEELIGTMAKDIFSADAHEKVTSLLEDVKQQSSRLGLNKKRCFEKELTSP
ncbi:Pentatricopeptide repeat [Dillenia turbinata]|uniref:Pentatricopeptide repeat n=1 Tax=Dillenia turbinata TaxID=194707 RepID=A0AAN8VE38_9MAGN